MKNSPQRNSDDDERNEDFKERKTCDVFAKRPLLPNLCACLWVVACKRFSFYSPRQDPAMYSCG